MRRVPEEVRGMKVKREFIQLFQSRSGKVCQNDFQSR
jgi:hypothetical protein